MDKVYLKKPQYKKKLLFYTLRLHENKKLRKATRTRTVLDLVEKCFNL